MKLFGGAVMAAIAPVLLVDASIMERLAGSLVVVGGAVATATAVALVDRRLRSAGAGPAA